MSEESVVRSPDPALPLPRTQSQPYGAGHRPDSNDGQQQRSISQPLVAIETWNQSQIFDVAAVSVAPFDPTGFPWLADAPYLPRDLVKLVPGGMTPPDTMLP